MLQKVWSNQDLEHTRTENFKKKHLEILKNKQSGLSHSVILNFKLAGVIIKHLEVF